MSAFFVSADVEDLELLPAKQQLTDGKCQYNGNYLYDVSFDECAVFVQGFLSTSGGRIYSNPSLVGAQIAFDVERNGEITNKLTNGFFTNATVSYTCPPDGNPDYTIKVGENQCGKPKVEDCPAGYHSKGTSQQLGSTECVPKECPPTGSSESLFSSPTIGGAPFDGGGLYCNDGCAYNVNESQISLSKYAIGVSQGVACGDKPYDNKKLADDADADQCTTSSDGTVTLLQCPDHHQPDPEDNPLDNSDSKVDESETPDKSKETCAEGDTSCNLKNVETEIENSINNLIDNDKELHNKKIDADTKNAKAFLNVMESIDTAILLQTSQDERLHAVTVGKFNELIDAVNGIETGGGGGGGNGTGNGNIGGQDCEGTTEECAGIGSGDGVELPQETRNLDQYAQKYNNWLPSAELPPEKCITLTNGKSLCFSFEYFIVFFQAISGLIVLSSLIHSASIIVRSV
tara:strand:- start:824 stop:2203 length:1380 start_codon:yes stop_codon:yes gene_type:complete